MVKVLKNLLTILMKARLKVVLISYIKFMRNNSVNQAPNLVVKLQNTMKPRKESMIKRIKIKRGQAQIVQPET